MLSRSRIAVTGTTALLAAFFVSTAASSHGSSPAAARFSGSAKLIAAPQHSADQRYSMKAELQADITQPTGRFALTARLLPDEKTYQGVCGPVSDFLFANGFDN